MDSKADERMVRCVDAPALTRRDRYEISLQLQTKNF